MNDFHTPVLLQEVIKYLNVEKGKRYIDATIGGGGHAVEILNRGGIVLGIDVDEEAIEYIKEKVKIGENLILVRGNFRDIDKIARLNGFDKVDGILFDLGVSSHQLEAHDRGFSFQKEEPLDMRMDQSLTVTAADLINGLTRKELYELFTKLGEERYARAISDSIVRARGIRQIETTKELADIVVGVSPRQAGRHPATKVFQALRIAVNSELENIKEALPKVVTLLKKNGKIGVISFHSLEDRIVKNFFLEFQKRGQGRVLTKRPVRPSLKEIEINNKSRSAKLRVFENI